MTESTADLPELTTGAEDSAPGSSEPIISGFYPDPSICRVGDTYYLVNSSFEYLPGIPIHSSTDLLNWTPVGNALTRPSQIAEHGGHASTGVFAPTIRHHGDRFWIIGTNVLDIPLLRGHFIIHADDPAGPWSDPVHISGTLGIDPDIAWDDDGACYVTWASFDPACHGIVSVQVDPETGATLGDVRPLWQGSGLAAPEGPHLYRIDGWWYVMLAEGGTERGHSVTIARARTLAGPFEAAPQNPFLTHRSTNSPVQNVGHADLIECADGSWAAVHLGVRPKGQTPGFHVNGRETFLVGIDWVNGWPVVDERAFAVAPADHSFFDDFQASNLDQRWLGVGEFPGSFTRRAIGGGLAIDAEAGTSGTSLLATRARDTEWCAETKFEATQGTGRFLVRIDDRHHCGLTFDGDGVEAYVAIGPVVQTFPRVPFTSGVAPVLRISAKFPPARPYGGSDEADLIELAVVNDEGVEHVFCTFDGRYLSTEVAGGFTGRVLGVEALSGTVDVRFVRYTTTSPTGED